jgi:hypothetical protein
MAENELTTQNTDGREDTEKSATGQLMTRIAIGVV